MSKVNIMAATMADVPELVALINSGYRGEASKKGWTTEAELLGGETRIDPPSLEAIIKSDNSIILKAVLENATIGGCVYLQTQDRGLYLGMLTVSPELQAAGIGRQLLNASEEYAIKHNCEKIHMTVISLRSELIAWYERRGYHRTGEKKPFPADERFGVPTVALEFDVLEKRIG